MTNCCFKTGSAVAPSPQPHSSACWDDKGSLATDNHELSYKATSSLQCLFLSWSRRRTGL